jgi:hypothetical protein
LGFNSGAGKKEVEIVENVEVFYSFFFIPYSALFGPLPLAPSPSLY